MPKIEQVSRDFVDIGIIGDSIEIALLPLTEHVYHQELYKVVNSKNGAAIDSFYLSASCTELLTKHENLKNLYKNQILTVKEHYPRGCNVKSIECT
jgi:hypothetical protein